MAWTDAKAEHVSLPSEDEPLSRPLAGWYPAWEPTYTEDGQYVGQQGRIDGFRGINDPDIDWTTEDA